MATLLHHHHKLHFLCFHSFSNTHLVFERREAAICSSSPYYTARRLLLAHSFCPLRRYDAPPPRISFDVTSRRSMRRIVRRFEDDRKGPNSPCEEVEDEGRVPFDINLAVVLAGFAFESYNAPSEKAGIHEIDPFDCKTVFLSEEFLREVYDGQLLIQLKRGFQFPGMDLWGTSDPYATLRVGDCVVRSKTIWATKEPVWDENFRINVKKPTAQYLQVAAWDANLVVNDRRMGNAGVSLESLTDGKKHEVRVELEGLGGGGVVELEVQYKTFSQIDADKAGWKIPLLSDFLIGKALEDAIRNTFGLERITARDFVRSALSSSQLPSNDAKDETQNGSVDFQAKQSESHLTQENSKLKDRLTSSETENNSMVEATPGWSEARSGDEAVTSSTSDRNYGWSEFSSDTADREQQNSDRDHKESLKPGDPVDTHDKQNVEADFLRSLGEGISRTLGAVSVDRLGIPLLDHVRWDGIDMIRKLGLESQTKAEAQYVESGLALPTAQQEDSPSNESLPMPSSTLSLEEVQKASLDLLKQTEETLGSWAVLAASLTGLKERKEVTGNNVGGKTTAIVKEKLPEAPGSQGSGLSISPEENLRRDQEMEELRKMFGKAESAVEAWAVLATSLGHTSFVKSAFEKICFLDNQKTDTQVAVWRDSQHHRLVVAFRGTEQVKWKDLRTDLMLLPTGFNPERVGVDFKEESMVHSGFLSAYDSVKNKLLSLVRTSVDFSDSETAARPQWHIYVTGHSLGGALATLFALELTSSQLSKRGHIKVTMYNFGSPRVGNKSFADQYNERVKDSWRVVNHRDIIPTVPRLMGYCHVAQPIYLTAGDINDATVNMEILEDGYHGDVIGEETPDFLIEGFMKGEKRLIERLLQTEIAMLRALRDGSALMQHMEDFYYISLLEKVSPRFHLTEPTKKD